MSEPIDNSDCQIQIKSETGEETGTVENSKVPNPVVMIPMSNSPIFPGMIVPIILSEESFTRELESYLLKSEYIVLNLVKSDPQNGGNGEGSEEEEGDELKNKPISVKDVYKVGVFCKVVKKLRLPDSSVNLLVHGIKRYRVIRWVQEAPLIMAEIEVFNDIIENDDELDAYTRTVINQVKKLSEINPYFNEEMKLGILDSSAPGVLADLVAYAISLDIPEAQDFLETLVVKKRFAKLLVYLRREKDVADIQKKISDEVNNKVNKYQREYFLREQLKVIRTELGMNEDDKSRDIDRFKEKIKTIKFSEEALKAANEELERLEIIPDTSPEYSVSRTYLNWLFDLPWEVYTKKEISIAKGKKILESDHYGLEKVKERILEFIAVRKLKPQYDGTILCLAGPPGVGKTSLGRSIASALGRKFYRFSLGGMRDESEIKGHRRTYVGAMPGRIIQALKRVGVNNPVIVLDEVDKLGSSYQGDPSSALLEVLDPEQNQNFVDHYLDVSFDLSHILFIATANYVGNIPEPLLDRMEVIELSGYTIEEKVAIAGRWIIPKQLKKHGLEKKDFLLGNTVIKKIISDYAREPGVRTMEQCIARLCRKAALAKVNAKAKVEKTFNPTVEELEKLLGSPRFQVEKVDKKPIPGVVNGLAWTAYGGDILSIETIPILGEEGLKLTGQLGKVMNESANIAYSYVKKILQEEMKVQEKGKKKKVEEVEDGEDKKSLDFLTNHEIHLHLPAGATPKDGPSAGITMALALYSLATNRRVKSSLAMTGELSLTGKVLPVGGIKEKVLAAKRAGIKTIILPKDNEKDLKEVPERHCKGLAFLPVSHFNEVLKHSMPR